MIVGEASYHAAYDHGTSAYLERPEWSMTSSVFLSSGFVETDT